MHRGYRLHDEKGRLKVSCMAKKARHGLPKEMEMPLVKSNDMRELFIPRKSFNPGHDSSERIQSSMQRLTLYTLHS